jgi:hypothetical protein
MIFIFISKLTVKKHAKVRFLVENGEKENGVEG